MSTARLVTHSEIDIIAGPERVWPHILEPNSWKQGLKPVRTEGAPDTVGEIRQASIEQEGVALTLTTETVVLDPLRRKVILIQAGSPHDPSWAAWNLMSRDGVTTVTYDVFGELDIGDADSAQYTRDQQARFDAELVALKELVEGHGVVLDRAEAASHRQG